MLFKVITPGADAGKIKIRDMEETELREWLDNFIYDPTLGYTFKVIRL